METLEEPPVMVGEILIGFEGEFAADYQSDGIVALETIVDSIVGDSVLRDPTVLASLSATLYREASLSTRWKVTDGWQVDQLVSQLAADSSIAFAEPNYVLVQTETLPDDPQFPSFWNLENTGQLGGTYDADIDAPEAWGLTTGAADAVIGLIDTGIDYSHPDLASNIWTNVGEIPNDGLDNDGNGYIDDFLGWDFVNGDNDPFDDNGHGTHVAGILAAAGNNSRGVTGVTWNSKIMPLKFLDSNGAGTTADAITAISYATTMCLRGVNIRLTNNSWGGGAYSQALSDAIEASGQCNMLFVASAGNTNNDSDARSVYPASYELDNIISVTASDNNDQKAGFANFGANSVDLAAPGVNIVSTLPGGQYGVKTGTSMAVPHVAGVAALAWSLKPTEAYQAIRASILGSVDFISTLSGITSSGGRLNAFDTLLDLITVSSDDVPLAIPDQSTVTSTLTFADAITVGDVNVQLDISHTNAQDLDVFLIAPDGTRVELFTDVGGNGDDFSATMLDDEAPTPIASGSSPFTGRFRPEGALSVLDEKNAQGTWTLEVSDDKRNGTGTLNSWSLSVARYVPVPPAIVIESVQLVEGDNEDTNFVFSVTRNGDTSAGSSVDYVSSDGTAVAGSDYDPIAGRLYFSPGETSKSITVRVHGDRTPEPDETFFVDLSVADNATLQVGRGIGTIANDDVDPPDNVTTQVISFQDFADPIGLELVGYASVTSDNALRLSPEVQGVEGGVWYTAEKIFVDLNWETNFSFNLNRSASAGGSHGFAFVIQNHSPNYLQGQAGSLGYDDLKNSLAIEFDTFQDLALGDPSHSHISVHSNGTLANGWDEALSLGVFNTLSAMDDGQDHSARVTYIDQLLSIYLDDLLTPVLQIPVSMDELLDLDAGTAWLGFTAASGGDLQNHDLLSWDFRVLEDTSKTIVIDDAAVFEGDSGTSLLEFSVTRKGDTSSAAIVDWTTADGSAVAGTDYVSSTGQLSFAPNETVKKISISVVGDISEESAETFLVRLSNATDGVIAADTATGTILNEDTSLTIVDETVIESDSSMRKLDQFITDGSGGLSRARQSVFGPDSNSDGAEDLYVASADTDEILIYDGLTGTFIRSFANVFDPLDLAFNPVNGDLYVSSQAAREIIRLNAETGAYVETPISGLADIPRGITFTDDGVLYIAIASAVDEVLQYESGQLSTFISGPELDGPHKVIFDGNGNLYVSSNGPSQILKYDETGNYLGVLANLDLATTVWLGLGTDGSLYASGRRSSDAADHSLLRIDFASGLVTDRLDLGRTGWSFMVGPDDVIYSSTNSIDTGNFIERISTGSTAAIEVQLSQASDATVMVGYSTAGGTATEGVDFSAVTGTLVFEPGVTSRTIIVPTFDDAEEEGDENFFVNLTNASSGTVVDGQAEATIAETAGGITVTPISGLVTSEAGGSARFRVEMTAPPTGEVVFKVTTSDPSEGLIGSPNEPSSAGDDYYLRFDPVAWYQPNEFELFGMDDTVRDGDTSYEVIITVEWTEDPFYYDYYPYDIQLTNIDDETDSQSDEQSDTRFFVVDSGTDQTFEYRDVGSALVGATWGLDASNTDSRGAASVSDGSRVWIIDSNHRVYVYDGDGAIQTTWTASGLNQPEGIATDGTHIWILDKKAKQVLRYEGAAVAGDAAADFAFSLHGANSGAMGITTDGASLWVVNDGNRSDEVFKYRASDGALLGRWTIDSANSKPTGITIDPSGTSNSLWIVDAGTNQVYEYGNARVDSGGSLVASFALSAANSNPQGIADPLAVAQPVASSPSEEQVNVYPLVKLPMLSPSGSDRKFLNDRYPPLDTEVKRRTPVGSFPDQRELRVNDALVNAEESTDRVFADPTFDIGLSTAEERVETLQKKAE